MPVNLNVQISEDFAEEIDKAIERDIAIENRSQYARTAMREKLQRDRPAEKAAEPLDFA